MTGFYLYCGALGFLRTAMPLKVRGGRPRENVPAKPRTAETRRVTLILAWLTVVACSSIAAGAELRGQVINGTSNRAGSRDEVVLLSLSNEGMREEARTQADRIGRFSVAIADPQKTHVVRVVHQGVTYHQIAKLDAKTVVVVVYDVAAKLEGVSAVMDVERFEATADQLEVKQLITMRNDSRPPRTLMNDRPFEVQLPPEAEVESGLVQVEERQPLKQQPLAAEQKGHYYFVFPIRPGDTRFAIMYRLPYSGQATIAPVIRNPRERFVVMLPKTMKFEPQAAGIFTAMPGTTPDNVQGTAAMAHGQPVAFRISGTGVLQELQERAEQRREEMARQSAEAEKTRPGGGLGAPIDAPDPLERYRWHVMGGVAILLLAGAFYITRRAKPSEAKGVAPAQPRKTKLSQLRRNGGHAGRAGPPSSR